MSVKKAGRESNILKENVVQDLFDYQIDKIEMMVRDMQIMNAEMQTYHYPDHCPKYGSEEPKWIKAGFANSGKQLIKCTCCKHRITMNYGQLTYYSHQDDSKWNTLIADTIEGKSLDATAADLNIHPDTVFRMRHKLLVSLEGLNEPECLSNPLELDETFFREAHKGLHDEECSEHKGKNSDKKRGISEAAENVGF